MIYADNIYAICVCGYSQAYSHANPLYKYRMRVLCWVLHATSRFGMFWTLMLECIFACNVVLFSLYSLVITIFIVIEF